jgi:hypothetical protein
VPRHEEICGMVRQWRARRLQNECSREEEFSVCTTTARLEQNIEARAVWICVLLSQPDAPASTAGVDGCSVVLRVGEACCITYIMVLRLLQLLCE